jgi:hypothetical protein
MRVTTRNEQIWVKGTQRVLLRDRDVFAWEFRPRFDRQLSILPYHPACPKNSKNLLRFPNSSFAKATRQALVPLTRVHQLMSLTVPEPLHKTISERFWAFFHSHIRTISLTEYMYAEFVGICRAVAVGFAVMGFIGFFVKLIHIPMYVP